MFMTDKLTILDGAMGTMLQAAGIKPGEIPELLNLTRPQTVQDVHIAYLKAGSQIIYSNTFGANRLKLRKTGHSVAEVVQSAVKLAKAAAAPFNARVALDIGPLGALVEPLGTLSFEDAYDCFAEMMEAGKDADLVIIETMTDLYETKAALLAAKEHTCLPVMVSMSFGADGRTFTGCTVPSFAHTITSLGADAIGFNCSVGPRDLVPLLHELRANTSLPIIAKPNAGLPDPVDGHYDLSPEDFRLQMASLVEAGATLIGGCCGTTPAYIETLLTLSAPDTQRVTTLSSFVCTPTHPLPINRICVIGERINPTGKKRFQQALLEKDMDYIVSCAVSQMDAGADILDVNIGFPGVDEVTLMPQVVKAIQSAVDLPLQLDSVNPDALEAGLRVYNGKAIINSVNGKADSLSTILPLARRYGAAVVGLTLDEAGLPDTSEKRIAIAQHILQNALSYGLPREDIFIDCLTLTVSAQQNQAEETLKAVHYISSVLGLKTLLGVSNISFGLPNRSLVTSVFLTRALHAGLTLPILNPNQKEVMDVLAAFRVTNGEDAESSAYIRRFADSAAAPASVSPSLTLFDCITRGLKTEAGRMARASLSSGQNETEIVEQVLIPALDQVGIQYEKGIVFLPQLLSAAQAAQAVFEEIRLSLLSHGTGHVTRGRILLATVHGDIHDIGKNIVKVILENYGYDVLDLGKDVPPETIAETASREQISLIGLSALMTTTLPAMEETVQKLSSLSPRPKVIVGGAVVTAEYAERIHADFYAKDAQAAVQIAKSFFSES